MNLTERLARARPTPRLDARSARAAGRTFLADGFPLDGLERMKGAWIASTLVTTSRIHPATGPVLAADVEGDREEDRGGSAFRAVATFDSQQVLTSSWST